MVFLRQNMPAHVLCAEHQPLFVKEPDMLNRDQNDDFNALLPGKSTVAGATRRTALKTALGVGYAAARSSAD